MICIYMLSRKVKGPNSNAGFSPPKFSWASSWTSVTNTIHPSITARDQNIYTWTQSGTNYHHREETSSTKVKKNSVNTIIQTSLSYCLWKIMWTICYILLKVTALFNVYP